MQPKIRILLVAGNRVLREALARVLRQRQDMAIAGECCDCSGLAALIGQVKASIVVIDSSATESAGLQVLGSVRSADSNAQALLIGMESSEAVFLDAVRAGAAGYLSKDASALQVIAAIRAVSQGEAVCPPRLCRVLFKRFAEGENSVPRARLNANLGLTRRQLELVPLIAQGLTNKEIASHLNLSEQTIKNHIHRMLRKVGVGHRLKVAEVVLSSQF